METSSAIRRVQGVNKSIKKKIRHPFGTTQKKKLRSETPRHKACDKQKGGREQTLSRRLVAK